jgi:hypothetical protein
MFIRLLFLFSCSVTLLAQRGTQTVLSIPVSHKAPLTQALAEVASHIHQGFTSFGMVVELPEPVVEVYLPEEMPLDDAIHRIVSQASGYSYEMISDHLIDVYPVATRSDPDQPVNVRVGHLRLASTPVMDLFSDPARYIPELQAFRDKGKPVRACGNIGPGLSSTSSARVDLDLHDLTVKQVLDSAAIADSSLRDQASIRTQPPVGWVLRYKTDPLTHERKDEWSFIVTVPRDWRELVSH